MSKVTFSALVFGACASVVVYFVGGLTVGEEIITVYCAMILGTLMLIARMLEKK